MKVKNGSDRMETGVGEKVHKTVVRPAMINTSESVAELEVEDAEITVTFKSLTRPCVKCVTSIILTGTWVRWWLISVF